LEKGEQVLILEQRVMVLKLKNLKNIEDKEDSKVIENKQRTPKVLPMGFLILQN
jgi:hypothetical protein